MRLRLSSLAVPLILLGCPSSEPGALDPASADPSQVLAQLLEDSTWAEEQFGGKTDATPVSIGVTVPGPGVLQLRFLERETLVWERTLSLQVSERTPLRIAVRTLRVRSGADEPAAPGAEAPRATAEGAGAATDTRFQFELAAEVYPGSVVMEAFELAQPGDDGLSSAGIGLGSPASPVFSVAPKQDVWLWTVTHTQRKDGASPLGTLAALMAIKADPATGRPTFQAGEEQKPLADYPAPVWQLVARFEPE